MSGYPFGPGGYGNLLLFFCHFQMRANDTAAQSETASRASLLIMSRVSWERFGRRGAIDLVRPTLALYPVGEWERRGTIPPAGWSISERLSLRAEQGELLDVLMGGSSLSRKSAAGIRVSKRFTVLTIHCPVGNTYHRRSVSFRDPELEPDGVSLV